jgi:uncharacterized protein (DUF4415 family)
MSKDGRPPITDDDGEARGLTEEDFEDAVWVADFGSLEAASLEALRRRDLRESGRLALTAYVEPDVLAHFAALGSGMDEAVNAALRKAAGL